MKGGGDVNRSPLKASQTLSFTIQYWALVSFAGTSGRFKEPGDMSRPDFFRAGELEEATKEGLTSLDKKTKCFEIKEARESEHSKS